MSTSQVLKFKILKQARLQYFLPYIPLVLVFFLALLFSLLKKPLGITDAVVSSVIVVLFVGAIAFLIWYNISPQGEIHIKQHEMVVFPFLRKAIRIPFDSISEVSIKEWWIRTKVMPGQFAGPVLSLKSHNHKLTIGCFDGSWKARGQSADRGRVMTCQFVVSKEDFDQILKYVKSKMPRYFSELG